MRILFSIIFPLLMAFNEPLIAGYQFGGDQTTKEKKLEKNSQLTI